MNLFGRSTTSEALNNRQLVSVPAGLLAMLCATLSLTGCYDSQAVIKAHKAKAQESRLVEVELGDYRITLPIPFQELERAEIHFDAFGYVPQSESKTIKKQLSEHHAELDHRVMIAIRRLEVKQITEPTLKTLREEIHRTVNETLANSALQDVGFRKFDFSGF